MMKMVKAFNKRIYVGKGYECDRLIKKWEKRCGYSTGFFSEIRWKIMMYMVYTLIEAVFIVKNQL